MSTARRVRLRPTPPSNLRATASATPSCAGARPRSAISPWCRPIPASCTRSTSSTSRAWYSTLAGEGRGAPTRAPSSAPARAPPWCARWQCWAGGASAAEPPTPGQPVTMLTPQVIGFRLEGRLQPGATATDLVLTVTEMLRKKGVVDKFVEFLGDGLANLPLADRATIANMAPEYGSTCGIFPIDSETLRYLELSGRTRERVELVSAYARA